MHKKTLGLSSLLMAGMLTVTSVSPAAVTAYATENGEKLEVVAEEKEEQKSEEKTEEAGEASKEKTEEKSEEKFSG